MHTTRLRKVGGSVMLVVPPEISEVLNLAVGTAVSLSIDGDRLVIERQARPRYRMADLLEQCTFELPMTGEEREWLDAPAAGEEMI